MLKKIFEKISDFFLEKKVESFITETEIGKKLYLHVQEYMHGNGETTMLTSMPEESRLEITNNFMADVLPILDSENGFKLMRETIGFHVLHYAELEVMGINEEIAQTMDRYKHPAISGELHHYITDLIPHCEWLSQFKEKNYSKERLIEIVNARSAVELFYINGLNILRLEFDDFNTDNDWLRPFIKSTMISCEDEYRKKISLNSLLENTVLGSTPYGVFFNIVISGEKKPYDEWRKDFTDYGPPLS